MLSVKEASKLAGVSKSAIFQRIKSGKLSAKRDHSNVWIINPAELERSFGGLTSKIEENVHTSYQQDYIQNKNTDAVLIEQLNSHKSS